MREMQKRIEENSIPEPNSGCWLWLRAISNREGYGQISVWGGILYAHRLSYLAYRGPIPHGLFVCHKCDVRTCVNPDHLFVATHQENMADRNRKGRTAHVKGEDNHASKVTAEQVRSIISDDRLQRLIAADYGITQSQVSRIKSGDKWKHVA